MTKGKLTIIVGGQYGSESKGKVVAFLANETDLCVRVGTPNAGHTVQINEKVYKLRQVPAAFVNNNCKLAIGPGALIDPSVLKKELTETNTLDRIKIDFKAGIIQKEYLAEEQSIVKSIGSTGTGCGTALAKRIGRSDFTLAKDVYTDQMLKNVPEYINSEYDRGSRIVIEGTQGFGLSLYHGDYPYVTSHDTTASSFAAEAGVSPKLVDEIILVIRTFPIRVAGNSGPLEDEINWSEVSKITGREIIERTTVTNHVRRVGKFNLSKVQKAVLINRPTQIALQFLNYLFPEVEDVQQWDQLSKKAQAYILDLEKKLGVPVTLVGTGADIKSMIDRRMAG